MNLKRRIHKLFVDTPYAQPVDLAGKHVIVTGAGLRSLGYETAKTLARWGATVSVTTRRNTARIADELTRELAGENVSALIDGHELDLSDTDSVQTYVQWYRKNHGDRLDILVNNAGIHLDLMSKWKEPTRSSDGQEIHWRTNYLGTAQLTLELLPLLRQTGNLHGDARIVNVGSQIHSRGSNAALFDAATPYNSWRAYGLSKLALIHFTFELDRRFAESDNLKSYCLHPGSPKGTYTRVADRGFESSPIIGLLRRLGAPLEKLFMSTAEEGAQTQIYCASSPTAAGGHHYQDCQIREPSPESRDREAAGRLWQETLDWFQKLPRSVVCPQGQTP